MAVTSIDKFISASLQRMLLKRQENGPGRFFLTKIVKM